MRKIVGYLLSTLLAATISGNTLACSFGGASLFEPTLERWEQHPGPKYHDQNAEGPYWEKVPAPEVTVVKVTRGSAAPGSSCDDAGIIYLEVALPESSTYEISEFGIYFRVVSGELPDEIFPDIPLTGDIKDGKMSLLMPWLDGHPKHQKPIDVQIEAFLVTNGQNVGPSSVFRVVSDVGAT